jgi:hypothetical protein
VSRRAVAPVLGGIVVGVAILSSAAPLAAQNFASPSVHFGAMSWPASEPNDVVAINLDRFTEFDARRRRYNALRSTVGLDLLALSRTRLLRHWHTTLLRTALAAGGSLNEPTRFLQNNFLHGIRGFDEVPVDSTQKAVHAAASVELIHWVPRRLAGMFPFLELGSTASTVSSDAWAALGARAPRFGFSGQLRAGLPFGGSAFADRYLTDGYVLGTISFRVPFDDWADALSAGVAPEIELSYTASSGYFRRADGAAFHEEFCSLRLTWGVAAFETWNDLCGHKDRGPTYGARLMIDARSIHLSKRP